MEAVAKLKNYPTGPRKMRLLADVIRGMQVEKALGILEHHPQHSAAPLAKLLRSAISNWEQKNTDQGAADANLIVKTVFVDGGRVLKRMRPAPQGRAYKEQRHYCHITIQVTSDEQAKSEKELKAAEAKARKAASKKAEAGEKKTKAPAKTAKKANAPKAEEVEKPPVTETVEETVEKTAAKNEAEVSAAKDVTTQTPAEQNETKPADEKQQDINEELERQ